MKNRYIPAVAGLAFVLLSASSARAQGWGFNCNYHANGSFGLNVQTSCGGCGAACPPGGGYGGGGYGGGGAQLGPWYNYFPLEANFQTPALPQYPYWPAPQVYNQGGYGGSPAPTAAPSPAPTGAPSTGPATVPAVYGPGYQPYAAPSAYTAGQSYYNPYRTASYPSYWYGR